PWVISSAGQIYRWTGSAFSVFGPSTFVASSVASGWNNNETFAVRASDHTIWNWQSNKWTQLSTSQTGTKVAVFSSSNGCGTIGNIHDVWIIDANHNIYKGSRINCGSSFTLAQMPGSASDITT